MNITGKTNSIAPRSAGTIVESGKNTIGKYDIACESIINRSATGDAALSLARALDFIATRYA
jgi:hypothetical protein